MVGGFASPTFTSIPLVMMQKVAENAYPVGFLSIPCTADNLKMFPAKHKHRFTANVQRFVDDDIGASVTGWYRFNSNSPDPYLEEFPDVSFSRTGAVLGSQETNMCGSFAYRNSQSSLGSWTSNTTNGSQFFDSLSEMNNHSQISQSNTQSVDLSLDLTGDIPRIFFPLLPQEEIYYRRIKTYIKPDNYENYHGLKSALDTVLLLEEGRDEVHFRVMNASPKVYNELFLEFGFLYTQPGGSSEDKDGVYIVKSRCCDLTLLKNAIRRFTEDYG